MPGHRSPDGTVMVRGNGGYPTNGEDDSKLAKVKTTSLSFFEQIDISFSPFEFPLNVFFQVIIVLAYIMVVLTFPISIWYCFKVFKISQNDRQHCFTFKFSGRQRVRESSHLQAGWLGLAWLSNIPTTYKMTFSPLSQVASSTEELEVLDSSLSCLT